jgi:hypothetical protein
MKQFCDAFAKVGRHGQSADPELAHEISGVRRRIFTVVISTAADLGPLISRHAAGSPMPVEY